MSKSSVNPSPVSPRRRAALMTLAALAAASALPSRAANHTGHADHHAAPDPKRAAVLATALDCVNEGELCVQHCLMQFEAGDTTLATCAQRVRELITVCTAVHQLAAQGSSQLPPMLEICVATCTACEQECRKHADKHPACKSCGESCLRAIEAAKAYLA